MAKVEVVALVNRPFAIDAVPDTYALPATESVEPGEVVPSPKLPLAVKTEPRLPEGL